MPKTHKIKRKYKKRSSTKNRTKRQRIYKGGASLYDEIIEAIKSPGNQGIYKIKSMLDSKIIKDVNQSLYNKEAKDHKKGPVKRNTLLIEAIKEYNITLIEILLKEYDADPNKPNEYGYNPLHFASFSVYNYVYDDIPTKTAIDRKNKIYKTFELLIDAGADVNAKNLYGTTPLHNVAESYIEDLTKRILELLLSNGADINARDKLKRTPLHFAVEKDNPELCEMLINAGADIDIQDNNGKKPEDMIWLNENIFKAIFKKAREDKEVMQATYKRAVMEDEDEDEDEYSSMDIEDISIHGDEDEDEAKR